MTRTTKRRRPGLSAARRGAALLLAAQIALTPAGAAAAPQEAPPEAPSATAEPAAPPGEGDLVTLDLRDARIENVLRLLAAQTDTNIIAGQDVQGTITVSFRDVDFETALGLILRSAGYAYRMEGNVVEVFKPGEAAAGPAASAEKTTATFALRYANGEEIIAALKPIASPDAMIFNRERNVLVVHDSPAVVERARAMIDELDRRRLQVRIEARLVEIAVGERESFGIDWTTVISANGSRRPWIFPFDRGSDGGDFFAPNQTQGDIITFSGSTSTTSSSSVPQFPEDGPFPFPLPKEFVFGALDFTQFRAVLELIDADARSKVVATPEITTLDNQEAVINIGETVPIPTYSRNDETSVTNVSGYEEVSVGTKLKVTPRVNEGRSLTLIVEPEVSDIIDYRGPNEEFPVTSSRSAKTVVTLEDGKTLVIGGLLRERTRHRESKFPLLGDIPLLSYLFTYESETNERSELMIFITPHIIDAESEKKSEAGLSEYEGRWIPSESADLLRRTLAQLASGDPEKRVAACETLALSDDASMKEILDRASLLERAFKGDSDVAVRTAAGRALRRVDVRRYAAALMAAGDRKDARALEAVIALATAEEARHLRWAALAAAAEIDRAGAVLLLKARLGSPLPFVAANAAEGIGLVASGDEGASALADRIASAARGASRAELVALARLRGGAAVRALEDACRALAPLESPRRDFAVLALRRAEGAASAGGAPPHAAPHPEPGDGAPPARWAARPRIARILGRATEPSAAPVAVTGGALAARRIEGALALLSERSPAHFDLVTSYVASVTIAASGPTSIVPETGEVRLAEADALSWSHFNIAHQLVHFATHRLLAVAGEDPDGAIAESICYEEQFRAVLALALDPDAAAADPEPFLDEVEAAGRWPESGGSPRW